MGRPKHIRQADKQAKQVAAPRRFTSDLSRRERRRLFFIRSVLVLLIGLVSVSMVITLMPPMPPTPTALDDGTNEPLSTAGLFDGEQLPTADEIIPPDNAELMLGTMFDFLPLEDGLRLAVQPPQPGPDELPPDAMPPDGVPPEEMPPEGMPPEGMGEAPPEGAEPPAESSVPDTGPPPSYLPMEGQ